MIEVHRGVLPRIVFRAARIAIGYDFVTERRFVRVDALRNSMYHNTLIIFNRIQHV